MKKITIVVLLIIFDVALRSMASDVFPVFTETSFTIAIPTNTIGFQSDPDDVIGSNVVYTLHGQIFTNALQGHIQTLAEGFSGTNTDKSTPWKTLTELLAAYQQGASSNKIYSLYTPDSKSFLDSIYTNAAMTANYQAFATSITNMTVLLGYDATNGFIGVTSYLATNSSDAETLPFYFVKTNGFYLLSAFDSSQARESNIGVFLNTHPVMDLLH